MGKYLWDLNEALTFEIIPYYLPIIGNELRQNLIVKYI